MWYPLNGMENSIPIQISNFPTYQPNEPSGILLTMPPLKYYTFDSFLSVPIWVEVVQIEHPLVRRYLLTTFYVLYFSHHLHNFTCYNSLISTNIWSDLSNGPYAGFEPWTFQSTALRLTIWATPLKIFGFWDNKAVRQEIWDI